MRREFVLQPFPHPKVPAVSIRGFLDRDQDVLRVVYALSGRIEGLSISDPSSSPQRKTGLWEDTCFELFMAPVDLDGYWEINLSPAGHWNVYRFDGYRFGMREETAWRSLPFNVERSEEWLRLSLYCDLSRIVSPGQRLDVGVSAVARPAKGPPSYWALCHRGSDPDFHRRDGFVLSV